MEQPAKADTYTDKLNATYLYFWGHGEDPRLVDPSFFEYHLKHGLTPKQIFAIACNRRES